jgi:surface antigen
MRSNIIAATLALSVLAGPALAQSQPPAPAQYAPAQTLLGTQLSNCTRNALIGAGVGAVAGLITAPKGNKTENAAIGGAVGGVGTYFACKYLGRRDQQRVESSYMTALNNNKSVTTSFTPENGGGKAKLAVPAPKVDPNDKNCRILEPTLAAGGASAQVLPRERYCKDANGVWTPAPL